MHRAPRVLGHPPASCLRSSSTPTPSFGARARAARLPRRLHEPSGRRETPFHCPRRPQTPRRAGPALRACSRWLSRRPRAYQHPPRRRRRPRRPPARPVPAQELPALSTIAPHGRTPRAQPRTPPPPSTLTTPPVHSHRLLRPPEHLAVSEHLIPPQSPLVDDQQTRPENRPPAPRFFVCSRDHTFPLLRTAASGLIFSPPGDVVPMFCLRASSGACFELPRYTGAPRGGCACAQM